MRWVRFSNGSDPLYGILEGDRIEEVTGDPFSGFERSRRTHALDDVKIEVPVIPRTFYCVGRNYASHVLERAAKRGETAVLPDRPEVSGLNGKEDRQRERH